MKCKLITMDGSSQLKLQDPMEFQIFLDLVHPLAILMEEFQILSI